MKAIEKVSAVQQVENSIRAYITSDSVSVGDKMPTEKQLCESLLVGRGTVREAIRLLQAKGFVEIRPGRGAYVLRKREPEREDIANWFRKNEIEIKDLIDVRAAIEPLAVKLAIEKATEEEIAQLCEIQRQSELATESNDAQALAACDEKFHSCIMEYSRNKILIDMNKKIISNLATFRGVTFNIQSNVDNFVPAHAAIIEAFKRRDVSLGQKSMSAHLDCVYADLERSKDI